MPASYQFICASKQRSAPTRKFDYTAVERIAPSRTLIALCWPDSSLIAVDQRRPGAKERRWRCINW